MLPCGESHGVWWPCGSCWRGYWKMFNNLSIAGMPSRDCGCGSSRLRKERSSCCVVSDQRHFDQDRGHHFQPYPDSPPPLHRAVFLPVLPRSSCGSFIGISFALWPLIFLALEGFLNAPELPYQKTMSPPVEVFPAFQLPDRVQITTRNRRRKKPVDLQKCELVEMVQYSCDIAKDERDGGTVIKCEPIVRLFRRCVDAQVSQNYHVNLGNGPNALN